MSPTLRQALTEWERWKLRMEGKTKAEKKEQMAKWSKWVTGESEEVQKAWRKWKLTA